MVKFSTFRIPEHYMATQTFQIFITFKFPSSLCFRANKRGQEGFKRCIRHICDLSCVRGAIKTLCALLIEGVIMARAYKEKKKTLLFTALFSELCEKRSEKILVNGRTYSFCVFQLCNQKSIISLMNVKRSLIGIHMPVVLHGEM